MYRGAPLHDKAFSLTDQVYSQWETADIKWSASTATSKTGWLLANGQEVSQTEYKRLYDDIGTTFNTGGETAGKFRVPNIAGKTVVSIDASDADFDTLGETRGGKTVTLTTDNLPSSIPTTTMTAQVGAGAAFAAINGNCAGTAAVSVLQPSIVLRAWVKT